MRICVSYQWAFVYNGVGVGDFTDLNLRASLVNFEDEAREAILESFPEADVEFRKGPKVKDGVTVDGHPYAKVVDEIEDIVKRVQDSGDWESYN